MSNDKSLLSRMSGSLAKKHFSISAQTDNCLSKVRWLQDNQALVLPDPNATEHFVSASYSVGQNVRTKYCYL